MSLERLASPLPNWSLVIGHWSLVIGDSEMREWVLAEQNHAGVKGRKWEVVVLPFGATEPHNLHMPYGTDTLQVEEIGSRACEQAYKQGASVLLLPTMP